MTSVPYPSFIHQLPVEISTSTTDVRKALPCVGRCRIVPDTVIKDGKEEYRSICSKTWEQAKALNTIEESKAADPDKKKKSSEEIDELKKLAKKYMKQSVAMTSTYLQDKLNLDVSIINVDVTLHGKDIIETDGCLASCWLDAGCTNVVIEGTNYMALEIAKLPRERIIAHFTLNDWFNTTANDNSEEGSDEVVLLSKLIEKALPYASTISLDLPYDDKYSIEKTVPKVLSLVSSPEYNKIGNPKHDKIIFELHKSNPKSSNNLSEDDISKIVKQISNYDKNHHGKVAIGLIDPTPTLLGKSYCSCMKTDRKDNLFTTVVCTRNGEALGLVYSNVDSVIAALECGRGVYYSRSRQGLWRKGDTSGHYQILHRLDVDCDGDALRFTVTQRGDASTAAFCHLDTLTCWGEPRGLRHLEATLYERKKSAPEGSYTKRLFDDSELLRNKLVEEAQELSEATTPKDVASELADVLYFAMTRAVQAGVSLDDAVAELDRRTKKVTRRKGDSKASRIAAGDAILNKK